MEDHESDTVQSEQTPDAVSDTDSGLGWSSEAAEEEPSSPDDSVGSDVAVRSFSSTDVHVDGYSTPKLPSPDVEEIFKHPKPKKNADEADEDANSNETDSASEGGNA